VAVAQRPQVHAPVGDQAAGLLPMTGHGAEAIGAADLGRVPTLSRGCLCASFSAVPFRARATAGG
jgi:hypothetical protein